MQRTRSNGLIPYLPISVSPEFRNEFEFVINHRFSADSKLRKRKRESHLRLDPIRQRDVGWDTSHRRHHLSETTSSRTYRDERQNPERDFDVFSEVKVVLFVPSHPTLPQVYEVSVCVGYVQSSVMFSGKTPREYTNSGSTDLVIDRIRYAQ